MQAISLKNGYVSLMEQAGMVIIDFRETYQQFHQNI